MTGVILVGGKSRRMGQDKAIMDVGGLPVFRRILDVFEALFDEILVVSDRTGKFAGAPYNGGYREVIDLIPDRGPLGGVYTGLYYSKSDPVFVASCDLPFINVSIIEFFIMESVSYDIVVPDIEGRLHPLHAAYSKRCKPHMLERLENNSLNMTEFINGTPELSIKRVETGDLIAHDPQLKTLFNMNTQQDWITANRLVK